MENKLEQLKNLKKISLTDLERSSMRLKLSRAMSDFPSVEKHSFIEHGMYHGLRLALSSFMFLILIGGGVSAVANNSLPGDPLYKFKLNVNEEVKGLLVSSTEDKVEWQQKRIETRLNEIKLLAQKQNLTKEKQAVVGKALTDHAIELTNNLSALSSEKPEVALKVTAELEQTLKAQKGDIEMVVNDAETKEEIPVLNVVEETINAVTEEEDKMINKELDNSESEIINETVIEDINNALEYTEKEEPQQTTITPQEP